jgi:hypothetical protein
VKKVLRDAWLKQLEDWQRDPVWYAHDRLGLSLTSQQRQLVEAIAPSGAKVSARAGHGVGKSAAVSAVIWWFLDCFEYPKIPCTAPSASQLRDVLWSELAKTLRRSDEFSRGLGLHPDMYLGAAFEITQDRIAHRQAGTEWFAAARTARKENPDALQGLHASNIRISEDGSAVEQADEGGNILFVVEEASGVDDKIFEVAEGALSSHGARLLMVGNPTRNTGYFADSHKKSKREYTALHFSCADSPLVDPGYREGLIRKFGEGSNVVRVRADGEFPKQDDDTIIAVDDAEALVTREIPASRHGDRRLGVDVARYGDDRTTFVLRHGNVIEHVKIKAKQDTMATANEAKRLRIEWRADAIYVDEIGVGAGVVDRLKELREPVIAVNVAERSPDKDEDKVTQTKYRDGQAVPREAKPAKLRDWLWFEMRRWYSEDCPVIVQRDELADDLAGEVSSVRYKYNHDGELVAESKDDMRKRGLRSPDIAEGLLMTFSLARNVMDKWARLAK